ncbi:MAG TPA: amidohydrolase family protein [Syntrophorhabdales bacterium]|nr:amidohydrolase family protein [Syntrophorhabdales bacterium]
MKIDAFNHIIPPKYKEILRKKLPASNYGIKLVDAFPALYDLDIRFRTMDKHEDYVQVINLGVPTLEDAAPPKEAAELARIANDEMAELVSRYPDRFVAAMACLPMNDMDAALKETDRAITELKLRGIQIHSDINGKPLDAPEFLPLFEKMAYYNLPILIHPEFRSNLVPDYPNETESKHLIHMIFGWPYRTTVAMTRLAMSGIFDKFPELKIITHHCGALVPFFENRIHVILAGHEMRMGVKREPYLRKRPIDYFRMFYADTVIGSTPALMCGRAFFGSDHLLFATDMPYDAAFGTVYVREAVIAVDAMEIPASEKKRIFEDNARELMRLSC